MGPVWIWEELTAGTCPLFLPLSFKPSSLLLLTPCCIAWMCWLAAAGFDPCVVSRCLLRLHIPPLPSP